MAVDHSGTDIPASFRVQPGTSATEYIPNSGAKIATITTEGDTAYVGYAAPDGGGAFVSGTDDYTTIPAVQRLEFVLAVDGQINQAKHLHIASAGASSYVTIEYR